MWTLIVFTMLAGRGTSTSVATLEFPTQQSCAAAAAVLAEQGDMGGPDLTHLGAAKGVEAIYRIKGKCIQMK
jgi:hypothetical protein